MTALNAILTEMAPHLRGTMMSLNNSFMYVGTTVGAALGGLILERGGFAGVGLMCAVSAAIAILLVGIAVKITPVRKAAVRQGIE
ncbi:MFS transporter [Polycladomyces sp. WAk]|uniref:MFS transporter n=1 Tax=Polycladomyces zharkentensis TaxID=2807616 RepID=A0ABS2WNB0_9BACL|nr:MFS transporter [Polycladomyces sp. WAk]MBN2910961.1 MFS transporter [Polycladomyces sp. WAk]